MKVYAQGVNLPDAHLPGFGANPTLGDIVSKGLEYAIVLGGIAMFAYLLWGGFDLLTSAGNPEGIQKGTQKIIFAIVGFLVIFASYFIVQLVETMFGFTIL
jgi:hypothetical protein